MDPLDVLGQVALDRGGIVTLVTLELPLFLVDALDVVGQIAPGGGGMVALVTLEAPIFLLEEFDVVGHVLSQAIFSLLLFFSMGDCLTQPVA